MPHRNLLLMQYCQKNKKKAQEEEEDKFLEREENEGRGVASEGDRKTEIK